MFRKLGDQSDAFPEERITCILQGSYGLMWFGTARGLIRYDSATVRRYRHEPDNPSSITAGLVRVIYEDREGNFWVGTNGGLNLLDRRTGQFTRFLHDQEDIASLSSNNVWSLQDDEYGGLWIGTDQGLDYLHQGRITRFTIQPENSRSGVTALVRDSKGILWVGTGEAGLFYHIPEENRFEPINHPKANEIRSLAADPMGRIWIGSKEQGLMWLKDGVYHFFNDHPELKPILDAGRVSTLTLDSRNQLLIGCNQGLVQYHLKTGQFKHYSHHETNPESLRNSRIDALFCSKDALIWAATALNGVDILDPNTDKLQSLKFNDKEVWSIFKDSHKRLWVGAFEGLALISPHKEGVQWSFEGSRIYFVAEHQGLFYCGTPKAFYQLNPETGEAVGPPILEDAPFWRFLATGEDTLWLGTQKGLIRYNPQSGETLNITAQAGSTRHLSNRVVTSMVEDASGFLWIGTFGGGLNRLNPKTMEFQHIPPAPDGLSTGDITDLALDMNGHLWIATLSGGLNHFNPTTGKFKRFTTKDGFPDNAVAYIITDGEGSLWVKTGDGVVRIKLQDHSQTLYKERDGFLESSGIPGARFKDPLDGSLYFGGIAGVTHFHPSSIYKPTPPPLIFTGFKRDNQETAHLLLPGETAEVEPQDKTFSLEFAVLDYRTSGRNRYAYLREDLDKDWVESKGKGLVDYTRYLTYGGMGALKIRGTNGYGESNEAQLILKAPPPLLVRTLPFTIPLTILLLTWLIWLAITAREKRKRARLEEQARMAEERALLAEHREKVESRMRKLQEEYNKAIQEHLEQVSTEIANELHDGALSDLTGLTFRLDAIAYDMEDAPEKPRITELTQEALPEICASLRDVCGDLLAPDFEAGLDVEMDAYADIMEKRCPHLSIKRELEEVSNLSPEQMACLFRIYRTLLKNVDKHAKASKVTILLHPFKDQIHLEIRDNGCGFQVPENWETFKKEKHYGMYMARYFAESLGGRLEVYSSPGRGTTAKVVAPIENQTRRP